MDYDSWSFYIVLIIVIIVVKFLIIVTVCCVHCNKKRQRVLVQTTVRADTERQPADQYGYDQNTISSSEFQPAFRPGPDGILGVYPPPYSEHTPKPPPYSPSDVYTPPKRAEEAMSSSEDPRVDISHTFGLVTRI